MVVGVGAGVVDRGGFVTVAPRDVVGGELDEDGSPADESAEGLPPDEPLVPKVEDPLLEEATPEPFEDGFTPPEFDDPATGAVATKSTGELCDSVTGVAAVAAGAPLGVANWLTLAALNCPAGFDAPTLTIPTLAATAPLAAVTKTAAAPATVSARCLFMTLTVETATPTPASRTVKNWQSSFAKGPKTASFSR